MPPRGRKKKRGKSRQFEDILGQIGRFLEDIEFVDFSEAINIVDENEEVIGYAYDLIVEHAKADYLAATFIVEHGDLVSVFTKVYLSFLDQNADVNLADLAMYLLTQNAYCLCFSYGIDTLSEAVVLYTAQDASRAFNMQEYWEELIIALSDGVLNSWEPYVAKEFNMTYGTSLEDAIEREFGFIPGYYIPE